MNIKTKNKITLSLMKLLNGSLKKQWANPSVKTKSDLLTNIESGNVDINDAAEFIRHGYVIENVNEYFWIVSSFINNFLFNRLTGSANKEIKGANKQVSDLIKEFNNASILNRISNLFRPITNFIEAVFKSFIRMYDGDLNTAYKKTAAFYVAIVCIIIAVIGILGPGIKVIYEIIKYLIGII
jgi:hypothetical protein